MDLIWKNRHEPRTAEVPREQDTCTNSTSSSKLFVLLKAFPPTSTSFPFPLLCLQHSLSISTFSTSYKICFSSSQKQRKSKREGEMKQPSFSPAPSLAVSKFSPTLLMQASQNSSPYSLSPLLLLHNPL